MLSGRNPENTALGLDPRGGGAWRVAEAALWAVLALGLVPAVARLGSVWMSASYLSYGLVFGPLALWLAWSERPRFLARPRSRDVRAGAPLALGFFTFVGAFLVDSPFVLGIAGLTCCACAVWLFHGPRRLAVMAFPLALATLSVPLPDSAIAWLTSGLQMLVTDVAVALLHAASLPVFRDGNVLVLPKDELFVAEACSGIASIFALLPAAALVAHFTQRTLPRGLALVALAVPIALFWNLMRVLVSVVGTLHFGSGFASGPIHESAGLVTFSFGCITLLIAGRLLERRATASALA